MRTSFDDRQGSDEDRRGRDEREQRHERQRAHPGVTAGALSLLRRTQLLLELIKPAHEEPPVNRRRMVTSPRLTRLRITCSEVPLWRADSPYSNSSSTRACTAAR
jgi:hypothetical protein